MTLPIFFLLKSLMSEVLSVRFQNRSKKVASISLIQNLLEWFIWTRKNYLWQTFHSSSGNSELLHSKRKLFEYDYEFLKKLHRRKKKFQRTRDLDFWQACRSLKAKIEYLNLKVRIDEEKFSFFFKNLWFWSNFSCGLRKFSSGTHANNSSQKSPFSCDQRPTKRKLIHFPAKRFYFKCFRDTKKAVLTTLRQSFC